MGAIHKVARIRWAAADVSAVSRIAFRAPSAAEEAAAGFAPRPIRPGAASGWILRRRAQGRYSAAAAEPALARRRVRERALACVDERRAESRRREEPALLP